MKNFLVAVFAILCFACSSNQNSDKNLPNWYVNPKVSDDSYLYGVGEGFTIQEASGSALNNLASKLSVSISSDASSLSEENNSSVNQEYRQKINEKVAAIKFNNYQVSNSQNWGNVFYAEIKVDRYDFIREQKSNLEQNHAAMQALEVSAKNQDILTRRSKLAAIQDLVAKSLVINEVLKGLNANPDFQKNLDKYRSYQEAYGKIIDDIEFFVKSDNSQIKDALIAALNREKLKIAPAVSDNKNLVVIDVSTNSKSEIIYGSNMVKIAINFKLFSSKNKVLASNNIEVSGASVGDKAHAFDAATRNLSKKIENSGLLTIIGIEK